jgi:hypothetical protein
VVDGETPGAGLVAKQGDDLGRRPDERTTLLLATSCEVRPLAEEPPAGMHGVGTRGTRSTHHRVKVEVGGGTCAREIGDVIGQAHVQCVGFVAGSQRDRVDAAVMCGADDSNRDLTTVGDQQALHLRSFFRGMSWRARCHSGGW